MEKKSHPNMNKGLLLLIILLAVLALAFNGCRPSDSNNDSNGPEETTQEDTTEEADDPTTQDTDDPVDVDAAANNAFAEYILDITRQMAPTDNLLWSTTGDVGAARVTLAEIDANADNYKATILANLSNTEVMFSISEANGVRTYTFNPEGVLNILGMGTHMGIGFPSTMNITGKEEPGGIWQATFTFTF